MASDKERDPGSASAEIGKYLDILAKDPNSRVFAPLAEAYRKAGLLDDAVDTALEGLKVHPNYFGGRVALGRAYFEKKQYAEAAAEMQMVVKAAPDNIIAHKVLGQIAYSQGDKPAAEKAFKMVLLLDPRDQEAKQFVADMTAAPPPALVPPPVRQAPADAGPSSVPAPPTPTPPPLDGIPAFGDFDLQADDIFGEPSPAESVSQRPAPTPPTPPAPPAPPAQAPLPAPPAALPTTEVPAVSPDEFEAELSLDLAEPELPSPEWQPPAFPSEAFQTQPVPQRPVGAPDLPPESSADDGELELEVFSRTPWGMDAADDAATPPQPVPEAAAEAAEAAAEETESPFEVFGRPKRGGPPQSTKGEQTAFGEIDLEATADEPVPSEPVQETDSPFETFTRDTGPRVAPPPAKAGRSGDTQPRELEVETTAYTPSDSFASDDFDAPVLSLDEELPRIDLSQEMEFGSPDDSPSPAAPASGLEPVPVGEPEPGSGMDFEIDLGADTGAQGFAPLDLPSPDAIAPVAAPLEMDIAATPRSEGPDRVLNLQEEIPSIDLAQETGVGAIAEEDLDDIPEQPSAGAGRGVFDTETLASIYVNQGFYGRAAEIYQRLIAERPDDAQLRGKLAGVLALEREEAGIEESAAAVEEPASAVEEPVLAVEGSVETLEEPVPAVLAADDRFVSPAPAPAPPAAPIRTAADQVINRLQTLLETFKGGRPR